MSNFLSNTASNLVGTFVGAVLALLSALAVARRERARSEAQRLQRLIDRIYRSRALKPDRSRPLVKDVSLSDDKKADLGRTTASVFITRDLIEEAANSIDPKRKSVAILDKMYVATLNYLDATEEKPSSYADGLMQLREELSSCEWQLRQLHPKLTFREPGSAEWPHSA
jgi:hypothetical protein